MLPERLETLRAKYIERLKEVNHAYQAYITAYVSSQNCEPIALKTYAQDYDIAFQRYINSRNILNEYLVQHHNLYEQYDIPKDI